MPRGRFDRFITRLACAEVSARACNPYAGNAIRRRNLRLYLEEIAAIGPALLLVGEAPSYRGGRLTGIPFVSETVMLRGVPIASPPGTILGQAHGYRKATAGPQRSTEASATMVWGTIRGMEPLPLLWNAFPFHPFHAGDPHSNRVPDKGELATGQPFLAALLALFSIERVVAVGNQASFSLQKMGIDHVKVRHPSQGGKNRFVEGMRQVEDTMAGKKSQIQQIKEGRSMHEKTYNNRNQPSSPKAPLPTKNAVRLSTVPSSSNEKFKGGQGD